MKWIILIKGESFKSPVAQTVEVDAASLHGALCQSDAPWGTIAAIVQKDVWEKLNREDA